MKIGLSCRTYSMFKMSMTDLPKKRKTNKQKPLPKMLRNFQEGNENPSVNQRGYSA